VLRCAKLLRRVVLETFVVVAAEMLGIGVALIFRLAGFLAGEVGILMILGAALQLISLLVASVHLHRRQLVRGKQVGLRWQRSHGVR
jgi:hypothetical protein